MRGNTKPFIVRTEHAYSALRFWLKERGCNTYRRSGSDPQHIQVGYDDENPGKPWGPYQNRGFILVCDPDLMDRTLEEIKEALEWGQSR